MVKKAEKNNPLNSKLVLETRLGKIEYTESDIVVFPDGLYGYEEYKRYVVFQHENYVPFSWLLSLDPPGLMFPIINPSVVMKEYAPRINGGQEFGDVMMVIVTIGQEEGTVTVNLRAPLLLDSEARQGRQVILTDSTYPLRYDIAQT